MIYGAAFVFDPVTEGELRGLWRSLPDAGLSGFMLGLDYPPHLTVFAAEDLDVVRYRAALVELAAAQAPLPVTFHSLGEFGGAGGVVYLAPTLNRDLLDLHSRFYAAAEPYARSFAGYYAPGQWVPHVTLAYQLPEAQLGPAVGVLHNAAWPHNAAISGIIFGSFLIEGGSQLERVDFCG